MCLLRVFVAVCVKFYVQFICALFCEFLGLGFLFTLFRACLMVYVVFIWCFCMFYLELQFFKGYGILFCMYFVVISGFVLELFLVC